MAMQAQEVDEQVWAGWYRAMKVTALLPQFVVAPSMMIGFPDVTDEEATAMFAKLPVQAEAKECAGCGGSGDCGRCRGMGIGCMSCGQTGVCRTCGGAGQV